MGKINWIRVLLGGIVAGVIVNVGEFLLHEKLIRADEAAAMTALGKGGPTGSIGVWIALGFVTGIALVWLYAAVRPRFGPGPTTAVIAGVIAWFFGSLMGSISMANMGLFASNLMTISASWELVQSILAAVIGCWVYSEG